MTEPERRLWGRLRGNRLGVKFQRQVALAPYIADFAARSERLVIELDGDSHAETADYDARRTAVLAELGYCVLRFTNAEVMTNMDGVLRTILIALGRDPENPHPLQGERAASEGSPGAGGGCAQGKWSANGNVAPLSPTLSP